MKVSSPNTIQEDYLFELEKHFGTETALEIQSILTEKKFFSLPASSRYHLCQKGGLALHSWYVYKKMLELKPAIAPHISDKEIAICGLFHDLNKLYAGYVENRTKSNELHKTQPYKRNSLIADYDSLSCYLISDMLNISLSPRMYNAIANHNIFHSNYFPMLHNECKKVPQNYALTLLLQMSDLYCSQIKEV